MTPQHAIQRVIEHREIFHEEMLDLMRQIMSGQVSAPLIAAIITGLRVKKETIGEITAAAMVMRELATPVPVSDPSTLVDTCGTGGDGAHTFNISTTAMFVAAAAGARIAKHGGRAVSSVSGSADVLEALGVNLNLTPAQVGACIDEVGIGFMFAANYHSAMKYAAPVRKELGVRTLFNILGPLTNPAGAHNQVMGVFHPDLVGIQARVLQRLGSRHVLVVHGEDGLDEITTTGKTFIAELKEGLIREYTVQPSDFGLPLATHAELKAGTREEAVAKLLSVLDNVPGPCRDIVKLNAGAAIYVSGRAHTLAEGLVLADQALSSGAARDRLQALQHISQRFKDSP